MEVNKEDYYSLGDIINGVKPFLQFLFKKWWLLLLAILIGICLGAGYYYIQKPKYEAVSTFILEEKQTSAGGLGSIASQFGIDIGGIGGGSIFTGDNILDILKSKRIVEEILLSYVDSGVTKGRTLADVYLDFSKLKEGWKNNPQLKQVNFMESSALSAVQDSVLNIIYDKFVKKNFIVDRTSKRGTIIKVQVLSENNLFAKLMTERLVDEASKMYLNIKTGTALANINRLQRRSDSLLALLNNKSFTVASLQPLDANPGIKTVAVPSEIAMRDKTVLATLYTEVTKNLETSKLLLSQQTPIIQILDRPGISLYDHKRSLLFLIVLGGCVSFFIFLMLLSGVYFLRKFV
jgi:hypothetical protein